MKTKRVWSPPETPDTSNMTRFLWAVDMAYGPGLTGYAALHQWSVEQPEVFWPAAWEFCELAASRPWDRVMVPEAGPFSVGWFEGARLNFAQNLLRHEDDSTALVGTTAGGVRQAISYRELRARVLRVTDALRTRGVAPGDRIAAYVHAQPEAAVSMLAVASIGAIWAGCPAHLDPEIAIRRFTRIEPKVLLVTGSVDPGVQDSAWPRGAQAIREALPTVTLPIAVTASRTALDGFFAYGDLEAGTSPAEARFEQLPFDHPLYITYPPGASGPRPLMHSAGGALLENLKQLVLHGNLHRSDKLLYDTCCDTVLWPWALCALAVGACVHLHHRAGSSARNGLDLDLLARESITVFGTGTRTLSRAAERNLRPAERQDLSRLRAILCHGSPATPAHFDYVRTLGAQVQLAAIAGRDETVCGFGLGNSDLPVYRGEVQCRGLGLDVQVVDHSCTPVRNRGGHLVCRLPFPSMPVGFWDDLDRQAYRTAFLSTCAGAWSQGDRARMTGHDGITLLPGLAATAAER